MDDPHRAAVPTPGVTSPARNHQETSATTSASAHCTLAFGGGCHWCTEAVFQTLRGVALVEQGFAASDPPHDAPSEAARVTFDPLVLPLEAIAEIHLRTHAATSAHAMRERYRSAVYGAADDIALIEAVLARLAPSFEHPLVTRALPLRTFTLSPPRFRDYYRTDPARPFCRTHIDPKLAMLRREFGERVA